MTPCIKPTWSEKSNWAHLEKYTQTYQKWLFFVAYRLKLMKTGEGYSKCHRTQSISRYGQPTHWRGTNLHNTSSQVRKNRLKHEETSHSVSVPLLLSGPQSFLQSWHTVTHGLLIIPLREELARWGFTPVPGWLSVALRPQPPQN